MNLNSTLGHLRSATGMPNNSNVSYISRFLVIRMTWRSLAIRVVIQMHHRDSGDSENDCAKDADMALEQDREDSNPDIKVFSLLCITVKQLF